MMEMDWEDDGLTYTAHELERISHVVAEGHTQLQVLSRAPGGAERRHWHMLPLDYALTPEAAYGWLASCGEYAERADPMGGLAASGLLDAIEASQMTEEQEGAYLALFPAWEAGAAYAAGQRVTHGGALYRVTQAHASQPGWEPQLAPALFAVALGGTAAGPDPAPAEWAQPTGSHDAYMAGDRVTHGGRVWESLLDGNVWPPGQYPPGWREVA